MEVELKRKTVEEIINQLVADVTFFKAVAKQRWSCPICGWRGSDNFDIYDHIVKEHCPEYITKFGSRNERISRDYKPYKSY